MSTDIGRRAEIRASRFLRVRGFRILELNWRTRWCEIDIIARKGKTIYFVEVKYRSSLAQGGGLDYITPRKLQQMHFAAELWLAQEPLGGEYRLAALELTGPRYEVTGWLDDI